MSGWYGDFTEEQYLEYLETERHMFAWCLRQFGAFAVDAATAAALQRYPYEPPVGGRTLAFHDEAWTWAMRQLFGHMFHLAHPELEQPSADYRAEREAFEHRTRHA